MFESNKKLPVGCKISKNVVSKVEMVHVKTVKKKLAIIVTCFNCVFILGPSQFFAQFNVDQVGY